MLLTASVQAQSNTMSDNKKYEEATLGAGCFWCTEAIFNELKGVVDVEAGYSGGDVKNPSYREVCTGRTGHVEVARITFDPKVISYEQILTVFFHSHDPTTLNRQGADAGEQYRSVIFYHNEEQKQIAKKVLAKIDKSGLWDDPIVTAIEPLKNYYKAENYHQDYFKYNAEQPYCNAVIAPKVRKLHKEFPDWLK